jgi:opacity protein-like surface antigen
MAKPELTQKDIEALRSLSEFFGRLNGDTITKKDFIAAFEEVVRVVLNVESKIVSGNKAERDALLVETDRLKKLTKSDFESYKADALAKISTAIANMRADAQRKLEDMQATVDLLENGKDADEQRMLAMLMQSVPTLDDIMKQLPAAGTAIRDALELLQGEDRLDVSAIRGLDKLLEDAKKSGKSVQIRGGGTRGFFVYIGGVKKGIVNSLNFVGGSGVSLSYSKVNGLDTLTINASGAGISVETPPESVDASTTVFTVSAQPQWIVSDGTTIYEGAGYSYSSGSGQVTLDLAPSSFIRAII